MFISNAGRWQAPFCLALALAMSPALVLAKPTKKDAVAKPEAEKVDVFEAIKRGLIEVKYIPKNTTQANLILTNKTDRPLSVELPAVFAGMPVLAQGGFDDQQGQGGGLNVAPEGVGFNIAPEKVRRIKVNTLCLDHGKTDPNPRMAYEIRPIEDLTTKPEVIELVARYAQGDVDVQAAQAAAWHLENGLSWKELAAKKIKHLRAPSEPYFTRSQLAIARQLSKAAVARAKQLDSSRSQASPSDSLSPIED